MKILLRRSPYLVFYWDGTDLRIQNYLTRVTVTAELASLSLLAFFGRPRCPQELVRAIAPDQREAILRAIRLMKRYTLLEPLNERSKRREHASAQWRGWGVEARYFHWATKDVDFIAPDEAKQFDEARKTENAPPAPFKRYPKASQIKLPASVTNLEAKFTDVLLARRTHRDFDGRSITMQELATLLGLTWGVNKWVISPTFGLLGLKTSPSGGARHPIEVYVVVRNVRGIKQGLYHYSADQHRLDVLRLGRMKERAEAFCGGQWWTKHAGALFIMTAIFERTMWLYGFSRALRNIYMEAGHLCQTFCLIATALNLAPFCSAALADSLIEREIGIDGIRESVLYIAAAGHTPSI